MKKVQIYLEVGQKRTLAVALDWPGWWRGGKDEPAALEAFAQSAPRYAQIIEPTGLRFDAPSDASQFEIVERVAGNAATDYGVVAIVLAGDAAPMDNKEAARAATLLRACWDAFDRAVATARGQELRKGPRGGGRDLDDIMRHVMGAEASYAGNTGAQLAKRASGDAENLSSAALKAALAESHTRVLQALNASAALGQPPPGPRGGARWPARYFVRRVAYHVVDHVWEIEDRLQPD